MAVYVMGDCHIGARTGDEDKLFTLNAGPEDTAIICGDFGAVWAGDDYVLSGEYSRNTRDGEVLDGLEDLPFTICFIDGNHENHVALAKYPEIDFHGGRAHKLRNNVFHLMRGEIYEIEGFKCLTIGGAASIDKWHRTENVDWWSQECPTNEEINAMYEKLKGVKEVDYVFTHQIPLVFKRLLFSYYPDSEDKYLMQFFDEIYNDIKLKKWFAGHYHTDRICYNLQILYDEVVELGAQD